MTEPPQIRLTDVLTERQIRSRREALNAELADLTNALDEKKRNRVAKCEKCGKGTKVNKLVYIQTYYYIEPYGCTGGDYWCEGEGQYDCPKCGHRNRLYNRPKTVKLKRFFAEVTKEHKR